LSLLCLPASLGVNSPAAKTNAVLETCNWEIAVLLETNAFVLPTMAAECALVVKSCACIGGNVGNLCLLMFLGILLAVGVVASIGVCFGIGLCCFATCRGKTTTVIVQGRARGEDLEGK